MPNLAYLQQRARMYHNIRQFFAQRQILEVETPILSAGSVPDPMIAPFCTDYHHIGTKQLFLQTSPELQMKRLLVAGCGAIYQIAKVFRDGEVGRWHNPEFTLLEWYRPGFSQLALIQEIDELLQFLLNSAPAEQINYCALFEQYTALHPLYSPLASLQQCAAQLGMHNVTQLDRDACLQFIMTHEIEPNLGQARPLFVTNFPASQAALALKHLDNPDLAERFELYMQGIELANGFHELTDPVEQRQRFEQDLVKRRKLGLPTYPLDEHFLAALELGMPDCSGVALGLDRLLMLITHAHHIQDVLAFPIDCV